MLELITSVSADALFSVSATLLVAAIGAAFTMHRQIARTDERQRSFEAHTEQRFDELSSQIGRLSDHIHSMAGKL